MSKKIRHRLLKSFLWICLIIFANILVALIAVRFPYFQTKLVQSISRQFSEQIGFKINVNRIDFRWFDQVSARDIDVFDTHDSLMIHIEELALDFKLSGLRQGTTKELDALKINGLDVRMLMHSNDSSFNLNRFVRNVNRALAGSGPKPIIRIGEIELANIEFKYDLKGRPPVEEIIDHRHFTIENIELTAQDLFLHADTLMLNVLALSGTEATSQLSVRNARTEYVLTKSNMVFNKLDLPFGSSRITDSVAFEYATIKNLAYFIDSVSVSARLRNTVISSQDLEKFHGKARTVNDEYTLSGDFEGTVSDFAFRNFSLEFGKRTSLFGTINLAGLPNIEETFVFLQLNESQTSVRDILPYLPSSSQRHLNEFDSIDFSGNFIGYTGDFVANGNFKTNIGTIISDINLKTLDPASPSYSGNLKMQNFDLGKYSKNTAFGLLDLEGRIQGSGFSVDNADFDLNGTVDKIEILGYPYQNIVTNATMSKEFFSGSIIIDDPNLVFEGNSSIDLRNNKDSVVVQGKLSRADLQALQIMEAPSQIKGDVNIKVQGLQLDSMIGEADLSNIMIDYKNQSMIVNQVGIHSLMLDSARLISLQTEKFSVEIFGNFLPTQAYGDIKRLAIQYLAEFKNDSLTLANLYGQHLETPQNYSLDFHANVLNANSFLNLFFDDAFISSDAVIDGSLVHGLNPTIAFNSRADSAFWGGGIFENTEISFVTTKNLFTKGIDASVSATSDNQKIFNNDFQNLGFEANWNDRVIKFNSKIEQMGKDNNADLAGSLNFSDNFTTLKFSPSDIVLMGNHWTIDSANYIIVGNDGFKINELKLSSLYQEIQVNGDYSASASDLEFTIDSLNLNPFNEFSRLKFDGMGNAEFRLTGPSERRNLEGAVNIDEFSLNGFDLGVLKGGTQWNKTSRLMEIDFTIRKGGQQRVRATGGIDPYDSKNNLNLSANVSGLEVALLQPYFNSYFSNLVGNATGQVKILGPLTAPYFEGTLNVNEAEGKVNYLNTIYPFEGEVSFDKTHIFFDRINLRDNELGKAQLYGNVEHQNFRNFSLNLEGDMQNFKVLNTSSAENNLYYGIGKASGKVLFTGPISNVLVSGQAKSERGTRIAIPMTDFYSVEQENFISFTEFSDTLENGAVTEITSKELSTITFDYDLEITPDAYTELIFDIKAGDIIRGRGNGNIKLKVDTKGDFYMFGDYEFESGGYNFTMYNIVNKEFDIEPKSTISWTGDPYEGQLELRAKYKQLASILPLLDRSLYDAPDGNESAPDDLTRRYPTEVTLELDGSLLAPNIDFEIDVTEYPNIVNTGSGTIAFETLLSTIQNEWVANEQEFNRQVFSLLVLRKFSPKQSFDTPGTIGSSVSEFVSNQLSYWISQVNENLEVDVNLGELSAGALNTFQLRLSYAFLEGRLRVTYDGAYDTEETETDVANILGDWTVEYLLSKDGRFRARMYKKTDYGDATRVAGTGVNSTAVVEGGFSLLYTISFDKLKDLFGKKSNVQSGPQVPLTSTPNVEN